MTQRNCAAVDVQFRPVGTDVLQPSERHRCERFVDFVQIDVVNFHSRTLECAVGREQWLFEHDDGVASGHRQVHNPSTRGEVMFFQRLFGHDQHRRRTVTNLAGVGSGNRTAFL